MGWCGYHLTSFEFYHQKIRIEENLEEYDMWGWDEYEMLEAGETLIDEFLDDEQWFTYIYDFGDYWKHRVTIEKVLTDYENHYAPVSYTHLDVYKRQVYYIAFNFPMQ